MGLSIRPGLPILAQPKYPETNIPAQEQITDDDPPWLRNPPADRG